MSCSNVKWNFVDHATRSRDGIYKMPGGGDVGHSLIWPIRVCAAEQGNMVFEVLSLLMMHHDAPCLTTGCLLGLEAFQRV